VGFDPSGHRRIMGCFATGVTVILTKWQDEIWGMTANSVTSLSLDPTLILVAVDRRSRMHECLTYSECFSVNVLTVDHEEVSRRFASRGPKDFSDLPLTFAKTGAPILAGALAFVDCRLTQIVPGGDHDIFIGEVQAGDMRDGQPLIYYRGQYTRLAQSTAVGTVAITPEKVGVSFELYGTL